MQNHFACRKKGLVVSARAKEIEDGIESRKCRRQEQYEQTVEAVANRWGREVRVVPWWTPEENLKCKRKVKCFCKKKDAKLEDTER